MRLAAILIAVIAITHYGYDPLASLYKDEQAAARALFYILRGFEGAALFGIIGLLARRPLVLTICVWGAFEEAQTGVCRLARGIESLQSVEIFEGLCGRPMYTIGLMIAAALSVHYLDRRQNEQPRR